MSGSLSYEVIYRCHSRGLPLEMNVVALYPTSLGITLSRHFMILGPREEYDAMGCLNRRPAEV